MDFMSRFTKQAIELSRSDAYVNARLALDGFLDPESWKFVLGEAIGMVDVPIVGTFIGDVWKEALTAYMEKWVDMEPDLKYLNDPGSPELSEIEQQIYKGDTARQQENENRMAVENDADLVERQKVDSQEKVEQPDLQPIYVGGPEVEAEIAEMKKLLDEQQQARDEQAAAIETMKQTFRETHEDDSPEQSAAHEEQLAAAEAIAQQALAHEQEAQLQALQARQVEMQRE